MSILRVNLVADTKRFNTGLNKASSQLKNFSGRVKAIGSSMRSISLPMALAGGAAIKMAGDFDKSMTKIKTLVGVASDEVDGMSSQIKALASEAAVSSSSAADAMFFITSAGLRGAEAMAVLEQATKAAAIGLGETKTVADLATSALNAYGVENLNAEQATDILTAAVREGKLESTELAGAMGRVLPIASNMGVQFHEVGAAFAAMSRTGTNANEAATQLRGILNSILKPTSQAEDMLKKLDLSTKMLRKSIREDGLLATLEILKNSFEGNDEAAQVVFGNVRALTGIMDLLGASVGNTREIFDRMQSTSGTLSKAFKELQNSSEFRLRKGLRSLQNSFSELGAVLMDTFLPLITKVLGFAQNLFSEFNKLSPATKNIALAFAGLAAALPTILTLLGSFLGVISAIISPVGLVASAVAAVAFIIYKNWNAVLPVVVGLYNRFVDLYNSSEKVRVAIGGLKFAFGLVFKTIKANIDTVVNTFSTMWKLIKEVSEKGFKGSFSDILEDGAKENLGIAKNLAEDLGKLYAETIGAAAASTMKHSTAKKINAELANLADMGKGFISNIFGGGGGGGTGATVTTGTDTPTAQPVAQYSHAHILGGGLKEKIKEISEEAKELNNFIANTLIDSFGRMFSGEGISTDGIFQMLKSLVARIMAAVAAAIVLSLVMPAAFGGKAGAGLAKNLPQVFKSIGGGGIPFLANGGIVSAPTLAMVGDNRGAGRGNPEVIAPLNKLEGMLGNKQQNINLGGEFRIQGQDLVLALQRAEKQRNRIL